MMIIEQHHASERTPSTRAGHASSPRDAGAMAGLLASISFLTGFGGSLALAKDPFPRPGASAEQTRTYFRGSARAARFSAIGQLISAVSLARFTASVARLAARSDSRALPAAAIAGGALAVASLTTAAVTHAMLTDPTVDDDRMLAMDRRRFAAGGPVHGVGFGVLTGVLGLAGLRTGELPRPVAITALAAGVPGVLSPLYFLWEPAAWLIPAGRFPGLVVTGIAGIRLSRGHG